MATKSPKEKAVEKALRQLNSVLSFKMDALDVCVGLYGQCVLTTTEYHRIIACKNVLDANKELVTALHRKGPNILDALLTALEDEEEANAYLIKKIKDVYDPTLYEKAPVEPPVLPKTTDLPRNLLGNGEWPAGEASSGKPVKESTDYYTGGVYKMSSQPRGMAIIINNRHFTCGMKERIGTDVDAEELTRLFVYLGFFTNRYDNLTGREMHRKLRELSKLDHSQYDCIIVSILTHGIMGGKLYSTDGDLIPFDDLKKYFDGINCPSLITKPKVFIVQACRGGKFDYGVKVDKTETIDFGDEVVMKKMIEEQHDGIEKMALEDSEEFFPSTEIESTDGGGDKSTLPAEADFVIAYATVPGFVSWRNSENGSWYIAAFVETMKNLAGTEHFTDILVEVNRRVAEDYKSKGYMKQQPAPVISLLRKLYFRPGVYS